MHWIWRNIIISSVAACFVFAFLYYSETGNFPDPSAHLIHFLTTLVLFNAAGIGMHFLDRRFNQVIPWNRNITARFFLEVMAGLVLLTLASILFTVLFLQNPDPSAAGNAFWQEYWDGAVKFGILSLVIVFIYAMVNFSIYSYNQYSKYQIEQVRLERTQLNLQFEALKSQLSPHFLFNALNTISSLIYRDVNLAEDFIRRMAHSFRYILNTNDSRLVSLRNEMDMLRAYFFMQKIKYESCVELVDEVPAAWLDTLVPPLTLQMLAENAMKHNLICEEKKLVVALSGEDGYLVVRNNIIPKTELLKIGNNLVDRPKDKDSHRIGLSNIRNRYAFFTRKQIDVTVNKEFIVKLPIIHPREQNGIL